MLIIGHSDSNNTSRSIGVRLVTSINGSIDDPYDPYKNLKDGYSIKQVLEWQTAFNKLAHDIFCYYQNAREKWPSSFR